MNPETPYEEELRRLTEYADHTLSTVVKGMLTSVFTHSPDDPVQFMIDYLKRYQDTERAKLAARAANDASFSASGVSASVGLVGGDAVSAPGSTVVGTDTAASSSSCSDPANAAAAAAAVAAVAAASVSGVCSDLSAAAAGDCNAPDSSESPLPGTPIPASGSADLSSDTPISSSASSSSSAMPIFTLPPEDARKNRRGGGRRTGVSAEPVDMSPESAVPHRVIPKSDAERLLIREAVRSNILFSGLDESQLRIVIDATERKVFSRGDWIIKQGDEGDEFYIVQQGSCETYIQMGLESRMVKVYSHGESFGELALMYNTARAASILAASDTVILWALDRQTFRGLLLQSTYDKRVRYETFLANVPLMSSLDRYERAKVADALREKECAEGEYIVAMGDTNDDSFYILLDGRAVATKALDGDKEPRVVMNYGPGDYFGELALLTSGPRAANVIATEPSRVVYLDRGAFERLLGPCRDILQRDQVRYAAIELKIQAAEAAAPSPRV